MGYISHNAIIVTSWSDDIEKGHAKAKEIFPIVGDIISSKMNSYKSFLIPPDGSKEGWDDSIEGDKNRDKFIEWLKTQMYEDHSSWYSWVEIQYGNDDGITKIIRHSDEE